MNNKGQSLITFILFLPLICLLIAIIIDTGNIMITKQKYENEIKSALKYGIKEKNENKIKTLLDSNISGQKTVTVNDNKITINVKDEIKSTFSQILKKRYQLDITYTAYNQNNQVIITKE